MPAPWPITRRSNTPWPPRPARHLLDAADCAYRLGKLDEARTIADKLAARAEAKTQAYVKTRLPLLNASILARETGLDTIPQGYQMDTAFRFPNSGYADFSAAPVGETGQVLFASLRADTILSQMPTGPIFETTRIYRYTPGESKADGFTRLEALRGLAPSGYQIGNPSPTPDGRTLFYSACRPTASGGLYCRIYKAELDEKGRVMKTGPVDKQVNKPGSSTTQPCVVPGKAKGTYGLYFVSDRKGGRGGQDIYYSNYDAKKQAFANAGSAGKVVNTPGNEGFPFLDAQTGKLYFSSDGYPGFGGMDVFEASGEGKAFDKVRNLGPPINSAADDHGFRPSADGKHGYLASNRPGALTLDAVHCCEDVFAWTMLDQPIRREGAIAARRRAAEEAAALAAARRKAVDDSLSAAVAAANAAAQAKADAASRTSSIQLRASKKDTVSFTAQHLAHNESSAPDKAVTAKVKRISQAIRFETGSSTLLEESKTSLDSLASIMAEHPTWRLTLTGHTDSKGKPAKNYTLGLQRAKSVASYVQEKGMPTAKVRARSMGSTRPAFPNTTVQNRARNRRVTALITEK